MGIDAAGIDLAVLLQGGDAQLAAAQFGHQLSFGRAVVDVVLQFVVHPAAVLHFVGPVAGVQLRSAVEFVGPHQLIAGRGIVGGGSGSRLADGDALSGGPRHEGDGGCAGLGIGVGTDGDADGALLRGGSLRLDSHKGLVDVGTPLLARRGDVDGIGATGSGSVYVLGLRRDGDRAHGGFVGVVAAAARKGHGEREDGAE